MPAAKRFPAAMLVSAFALLAGAAAARGAETVENRALGFTLKLPDGFQKQPGVVGTAPNVVHAFAYGDPTDAEPDILLFIERMRGTIGRERLSEGQLPPGFKGSLFTVKWHRFEVDAFEIAEEMEGLKYLTYNVQIPLKREAIQVKLFGPAERKEQLRKLLPQVLNGLSGESNWLPAAAEGSTGSFDDYGKILLVVGGLAVLGGLLALWAISRKTPKGTVLAISVAIYATAWTLSGARVREVILLCGILKMLGFAGIILGIVDLVRKRKKKPPAPAPAEEGQGAADSE